MTAVSVNSNSVTNTVSETGSAHGPITNGFTCNGYGEQDSEDDQEAESFRNRSSCQHDYDMIAKDERENIYKRRRSVQFPAYTKPDWMDQAKPKAYSSHRSKSETHIRHLDKGVTVKDLKRQWRQFFDSNGTTGRYCLGALISAKPASRDTISSPNKDATSDDDEVVLVRFGDSGSSPKVETEEEETEKAGIRSRRQVSFADEVGKSLCDVQVYESPSSVPFELDTSYVWTLIYERITKDPDVPSATWDLDFSLSDTEESSGVEKLQKQMVLLDALAVWNELPCRITGTVQVLNIGYQKQVSIRITDNQWISYRDHAAKYLESSTDGSADIFAFEIDIPPDDRKHKRLEFCISFSCNGHRHWDNNNGINYVIISQSSQMWWTSLEADNSQICY